MKLNKAAITAFFLSVGGGYCFSGPVKRPAFYVSQGGVARTPSQFVGSHDSACDCMTCTTRTTLYASVDETTEEAVPENVMAMDGVESADEAHNVDRPARKYISRKKGKPLSDYNVGDSVKATVKSFASYGAFMDIGATTDGLLHISQVSKEYVSDVSEVLDEGQEVEVRITKIDEASNKVSLSLLTEEEASSQGKPRQQRQQQPRRDDSAVLAQLSEKGWNSEQFVEGTVVSTVDFGAFVRVDCSQLNEEITGEMDGLVHISALAAGRVDSVTSVVKADDKVQVRVRSISDGRKVSLTMISPEEEKAMAEARGGPPQDDVGNKEWREDLAKLQGNLPTFKNGPVVVDKRK